MQLQIKPQLNPPLTLSQCVDCLGAVLFELRMYGETGNRIYLDSARDTIVLVTERLETAALAQNSPEY